MSCQPYLRVHSPMVLSLSFSEINREGWSTLFLICLKPSFKVTHLGNIWSVNTHNYFWNAWRTRTVLALIITGSIKLTYAHLCRNKYLLSESVSTLDRCCAFEKLMLFSDYAAFSTKARSSGYPGRPLLAMKTTSLAQAGILVMSVLMLVLPTAGRCPC